MGSITALTATIISGTNVLYHWAFGDGETGSGAGAVHVYPAIGIYTAAVTASNSVSLLTATTVVTITDVPISGLLAVNDSPTLLGVPTHLTATVAAGSNVAYQWALGDGTPATGQLIAHTYPDAGPYTAIVTASNSVSTLTATTVVSIVLPGVSLSSADYNVDEGVGEAVITVTLDPPPAVTATVGYGTGGLLGVRPIPLPLTVTQQLEEGECFTAHFKNCDPQAPPGDPNGCYIYDDQGDQIGQHRNWTNLNHAWNEGEAPDFPRATGVSANAADLKLWMESGWANVLYADCLWEEGCHYGDYVHAKPGTDSSPIGHVPIDTPFYIPVFDLAPHYDEIPEPKADPVPQGGDYFYHIVGFACVTVAPGDADQGGGTIRACIQEVVTGAGLGFEAQWGTATPWVDYTPVSGTLTFAPGMAALTFTVPITDDAIYERDETVLLSLHDWDNLLPADPITAILTIVDNDNLPEIGFSSGTYDAGEGEGTAVVTATLNGGTAFTATVDYVTSDGSATGGADYLPVSGTLVFPPGITALTFTLPITNDVLYEGDETVWLALGNPISAVISLDASVLTIVDDEDPPLIAFSSTDYSVGEDAGLATITVVLSGSTALTATVDYATSDGSATGGEDYVPVSGTLTFAPSVASQFFTIIILSDSFVDPDETVLLSLTNPMDAVLGTPAEAVLTIVESQLRVYLPVVLKD